MDREEIIIIGGGVCGLMAAMELSRSFSVTLLETRNELGGRIRSFTSASGIVIEEGPEFIHGALPITLSLLKDAGIEYVQVKGKMYRKENNHWSSGWEMDNKWDSLLEKMEGQPGDISLQQFLNDHFDGEENNKLRQHAIAYAEGFDLADPAKASVVALYQEWSHEGDSFRIPGGYKTLVDYLEKKCLGQGCSIIVGDAVKRVEWGPVEVHVYTAGSKKYMAAKLVTTLPVGLMTQLLPAPVVDFYPAIDNYRQAFGAIGFGTVVRVVLHFKTPFWKSDTGFALGNTAIPTWWTHRPIENNLFTGWAGGAAADRLSMHTDDELLSIALQSLSDIYELPVNKLQENLLESFVFNWKKFPEAAGAYSYATTESAAAKALLKTPIENTLFFAGEGLYEGKFPGTVEAALVSGKEVAAMIFNSKTTAG